MSSQEEEASRLIEWTGERCVPWVQDAAMLYEHFHRYHWAARLTAGRRVLDLGSGEGFGAAILAGHAAEVLGVDVDERAVEHARLNYRRSNLDFERASALDLSQLESDRFDAVVAFEMIEHVADHDRMMAEIARVLRADGMLIVSTPDRNLYSEATGQVNDFHEHELTVEELRSLLAVRYPHVKMYGQRTVTGSFLSSLAAKGEDAGEEPAGVDFFVESIDGGGLMAIEEPAPLFCVALASTAPLPEPGRSSTLADYSLELVHQTARAHGVAVAERDRLLAEANERINDAHAQLGAKREEVLAVAARLTSTEQRLSEAQEFVDRVQGSASWQAFERLRGAVFGLAGEDSVVGRVIKVGLRLIGGLLAKSPPR
jgi:SAM-dependent methyltransferase